MAREKGMGNLQQEKSGRWTLRVGVAGKRLSRSTGTTDREAAERFAQRFLSPLGCGKKHLPLSDVWFEYERSPKRRDLAPATLQSKQQVWMMFARWMERGHVEVSELGQLTAEMVGEYLRCLRIDHCATTYNNHVCVLREIYHVLAGQSDAGEDPWADVRLLCAEPHSRRAFTVEELSRVLEVAEKEDLAEWRLLLRIGIYTGLRLGDCCLLRWGDVNLETKILQVIPRKTRKHAHGRPVTIPIHPILEAALRQELANGSEARASLSASWVMPQMGEWYEKAKWRVEDGLKRIFKGANIEMSVRVDGRRYRAPEATFHSLRHTFVSFAANAGVPLPVVQSIVGHTSTAMTRHYYHESETELRRAVDAIPSLTRGVKAAAESPAREAPSRIGSRLLEVKALRDARAITEEEYAVIRARILAEI